jgi:type II secretory pathway pseudopilin PulG
MPKSRRVRSRGESGTVLLEVLVVVLLLAVVVGGLLPILSVGQQTWAQAGPRSEMVQNARTALDRLIREMRAAQTFQVISATNIRFSFFLGDGTTAIADFQLNTITNELEYRRDTDPFQPFAGPFRSMSVSCWDDDGASIACTSPGSVRTVQVALVVMDPEGQIPDMTLTSSAYRQVP